ncbi:MAG TPA: hypothetical protein VEK15_26585 [Vicinamibacteria bacterium]|nr:hypothetical protein [Vicinamibacteria bacterium]
MNKKRKEGAPPPGRERGRAPESEIELREFLDHAPVGLRFVSRDGRFAWIPSTNRPGSASSIAARE